MPKKSGPRIETATIDELIAFQNGGGTIIGGTPGGQEFYFSPSTYYVQPKIDGEKVRDTLENEFVARGIDDITGLMFSEEPVIQAYNESGEEDTELGTQMMKDFEAVDLLETISDPGLLSDVSDVQMFNKMKLCFKDIYSWGPFLCQVKWKKQNDGWVKPQRITRLPPETFINPPPDSVQYYSGEILKGIGLRNGVLEFWQTQVDSHVHKLEGVIMMRDPLMPGVSGKSHVLTLIPTVSILNFSNKAEVQKVGRIGAPSLFIKFTERPIVNAQRDDVALAKLIIQNWGKESQFALRENMDIVKLDFADNQSARLFMADLKKDIADHFNPTRILSKEGNTIGGNDAGKVNVLNLAMQNIHLMITKLWQPIAKMYLNLNGYDGYTVKITLPVPKPDITTVNVQVAEAGDRMGVLTLNEKRKSIGFPEADEKLKAEIEEERKKRAATVPGVFMPGAPPAGSTSQPGEAPDEEEEQFEEDGENWVREKEMMLFPFPNEHAARMVDPDKLENMWSESAGGGVRRIMGYYTGTQQVTVQAYRFKTSRFTVTQAKAWLKKKGKHPIRFEPASGD